MSDDLQPQFDYLLKQVKSLGAAYFLQAPVIDLRSFPYINVSYSSSGEDLWLRQAMKPKLRSGKPGFYVDVGANRPMSTSNTFLFYCQGWQGVCIDANPRFREEFGAIRPRDIFINAAVSDMGQSLYFAEFKGPAGHKMARVKANPAEFDHTFQAPVVVPAMTLAEILRRHVPKDTQIDFMTMDLEDSELPALRSNDWAAYMPRVILIEAGTGFDPLAPFNFNTIGYLRDLGYRYLGFSNNNVLMFGPNYDL